MSVDVLEGARCSAVIRAFAYGVLGRRIDPSWWTHWAISQSSQCSTTGLTKAMVCGMMYISSLCGGSKLSLTI